MRKAGLEIHVDAIGNTYGLWKGSNPSLGTQDHSSGLPLPASASFTYAGLILRCLHCDHIGSILSAKCDKFSSGKIMTGSHADSIVHGGVYDGALGVVGAIAAVAGLKEEGFQPERSIEVVQFTSEEGDRFSEVCFGRSAACTYSLQNFCMVA